MAGIINPYLSGQLLFSRKPYIGNGGAGQSIVNNLDTDLVWIKNEDAAGTNHILYDAVRGVINRLEANNTGTEGTFSGVSAFNVDGFSLGGFAGTNNNANNYVSFAWKEAANYFDIVTFTGTEPTPQTINHNLGGTPDLMIMKSRTQAAGWWVYHSSLGATKYDFLNTGGSAATSSTAWNNTAPTSTQFTVGSSTSNAGDMVAYLFKALAGSSAFGSYTGTGTTTQQDINIGFAPTIVWIKNTNVGGDWLLLQSTGKAWHINSSNASFNGSTARSNTSATGFSVGTSGTNANGDYNNSGDTYIYCAWKSL